jgi:hypothetical protein
VTRREKTGYSEEVQARNRLAVLLQSLKLLGQPPKKKRKGARDGDGKEGGDDFDKDGKAKFKVGSKVEFDYEGEGRFWPCEVVRVNDDGTYDVEYVGDYKVGTHSRSLLLEYPLTYLRGRLQVGGHPAGDGADRAGAARRLCQEVERRGPMALGGHDRRRGRRLGQRGGGRRGGGDRGRPDHAAVVRAGRSFYY